VENPKGLEPKFFSGSGSFHVVLPNLNQRVAQDDTQGDAQDVGNVGNRVGNDVGNEPEGRDMALEVLSAIRADVKVSAARLAKRLAVSCRTIERVMSDLRKEGCIRRVGGTRGHWEVN